MSNQKAPARRIPECTAVLAPSPSLEYGWRAIVRINDVLGTSELTELREAALDIPRIGDFRPIPDQQMTPHTMVILEFHSVSADYEVEDIVERYLHSARAVLCPEADLSVTFSSRPESALVSS